MFSYIITNKLSCLFNINKFIFYKAFFSRKIAKILLYIFILFKELFNTTSINIKLLCLVKLLKIS